MQRYYSPSTRCTYLSIIHGEEIPRDALKISEALYREVIASPAPGKVRSHLDNGLPKLIDAPAQTMPTFESVELARLRAYADPENGSDRHFNEANRETLLGNAEAAERARLNGFERYSQIQTEHPWPQAE